jgi:formyl-CoA transferase
VRKSDFYREARRDLPGPLAGVRVLEATSTWAGPMCGCVLADFGADVIKVEPPDGEVARRLPPTLPGANPPVSALHATVNRNKRSVCLDLRAPRGRDLFLRLAATADLVVENFRPGTLDRLGLGYGDLRAMNGDVILVSISGFGQFGRDSERAGYDPLAQAASGFLSLNGSQDGEPVKAPTFLGDDLGGLHAALAALAALRHRDRTGEGQHIDVSLLDAMWFQTPGYLTLGALGQPLPRLGNQFRVAAPANLYRCADGAVVAGVLLDGHWRVLARLVGRPELAEDPAYATTAARLARRDTVDAVVAAWTATRTVADVVDQLVAAGLPVAPVRSYEEAARDPLIRDREMLQEVDTEGHRRLPIAGPPAKFSRTPTSVRTGAPALGAHTDEILAELGVDPAERTLLRKNRVI